MRFKFQDVKLTFSAKICQTVGNTILDNKGVDALISLENQSGKIVGPIAWSPASSMD